MRTKTKLANTALVFTVYVTSSTAVTIRAVWAST